VRLRVAPTKWHWAVATWLELSPAASGTAGGQACANTTEDHQSVLRREVAPCRVIAFSGEVIGPPQLAAEVADAIPDCDYVEIVGLGHRGLLERPREANTAVIEFLSKI